MLAPRLADGKPPRCPAEGTFCPIPR